MIARDVEETQRLLTQARAGDAEAFRELSYPLRRELLVHCYRMLGSFQDAEDALQDALLTAWQGLHAFEERAAFRTWLYRIATNRCLNVLRSASRRPAEEWRVADYAPPEPTRRGEVPWLEPIPDSHLDSSLDPETRYQRRSSISLAFVTALQLLPPRQVAVLLLRDVLEFSANEVAEMLDSTVEAVNGLLKRARSRLQSQSRPDSDPAHEDAIVAKFVSAYEAGDLQAVVALLTDDVFMSMPPIALEYEGREAVAAFCAKLLHSGRSFDLVRTRANGQPAFGAYLRSPNGVGLGTGLIVLGLAGEKICALTHFESSVLSSFGLPLSHPGKAGSNTLPA